MSEGYFEEDKDLYTDVELLKKDMHGLYRIVDKLDVTIEKLTHITTSMDKMINIQQANMDAQEQDDKYLMTKVGELSDRVKKLEAGKWFFLGIAASIGFILAQLPLLNNLLN